MREEARKRRRESDDTKARKKAKPEPEGCSASYSVKWLAIPGTPTTPRLKTQNN
jgi:hypothetical protein